MSKIISFKILKRPTKIVEIPDNGNNKKIEEGERVINENIKQAKRIIKLKNEGHVEPAGRGGTITDESMEEMQDLTYGDLKPSGVSDSLALGAPETEHQAQQIYNKFTQRFNVLLTSNFGTKMERTLQQAFPEGTSFLGYLQRATIVLSILYRFPDAEPNEIVNALRRHRVLYRNMMMWNKRMLEALDDDLLKSRIKKATSADKGPAIRKYPKYKNVIKKDFEKTVRKLHTPKASTAQIFSGDELLIKDNLEECIDAMKDAEYRGDKDGQFFWKTEIKKLKDALDLLKRREAHMRHAASLIETSYPKKDFHKNMTTQQMIEELERLNYSDRQDIKDMGPKNDLSDSDKDMIDILLDNIEHRKENIEYLKKHLHKKSVKSNILGVTAMRNKSILKHRIGRQELDPRAYIGTIIEGPLNVPVLFDGTTDTYTEEETGAIISNRRLIENPWLELTADGFRKIHQLAVNYNKKMPPLIRKTAETVQTQPTDYYEEKLQPSMKNVIDKEKEEIPAIDGAQPVGGDPNKLVKIESADKSKLRQRLKSHKENLRHLKEMRTNVTAEKGKSKEPGKYVDRVSKLNNRIRKEEEQIATIQKQISKASFTKAEVETSAESVEADVVPSNDPHVLAHDDLEVHLNGAGFTLEMVHPEDKAFRTYVAWYHSVPLNGVGNNSEENKAILGGAFFAACQGTNFAPIEVGEGWIDETNDDGGNSDVFKMIDKNSKTSCCADVSTNHISFYVLS